MNSRFRTQIPKAVIALLDDIEMDSGRPIEVVPNPHPLNPDDPNPDALGCSVNEQEAVIFCRNEIDFKPQAVCHELLHIKRYWVEGVPQIFPKRPDPDRIKITSHIENALEHLVIVPKEAQYGFEPYSHWNKTTEENWATLRCRNAHPWAMQKNCLLGWLTVKFLVTDGLVKQRAEETITALGHFPQAEAMAKRVGAVLHSKAKMISRVVEALQIPREDVHLIVFDPRSAKKSFSDIPLY